MAEFFKDLIKKITTAEWLKAATNRSIRTGIQTILASITVGNTLADLNIPEILSITVVAMLVTFLTSALASMPELDTAPSEEEIQKIEDAAIEKYEEQLDREDTVNCSISTKEVEQNLEELDTEVKETVKNVNEDESIPMEEYDTSDVSDPISKKEEEAYADEDSVG